MTSALGRSYQLCENQHLIMARYKNWGLIEKKSVAPQRKHTGRTNSGTALALARGSAAAREGTPWGCPGRRERGLPRSWQNRPSVGQGTDRQEIKVH